MSEVNVEQVRHWNEVAGPSWVRLQEKMDRQIEGHGLAAIERAAPRPGEAALDVGCGCGGTTLELARRFGEGGRVLGADISRPMLARARERAAEAGAKNVAFAEADAQTARFPGAPFDLVFSRFGVMFFADPAAAFANLRAALRPGGRVTFVCWQRLQDNPWVLIPFAAMAPLLPPQPPPAPDAPGPFAFADPERVRAILARAGFAAISVDALHLPMSLGGGDLEDAVGFALEIGPAASALRSAGGGDALRARVADALREALRPHAKGGPIRLPSAAWIASARSPE